MLSTHSPTQRLVVKWLCVAVLSDALIYLCYRHTLVAPGTLNWNPWAYSDWLINYSAGFVRRGLGGYLIGLYAGGHPAAPIVNTVVFANFTALIFATSLLLILSRPLGAFAAVLLLLIPGGVWSMQFANALYYRKEVLFYAYIALICVIYLLARRTARTTPSYLLDALNCGAIAIFSIALSFVDEVFLFIGALPSIVVLYWIISLRRPAWRLRAPAIYAAAMVGLFLMFVAYKGDRSYAQAIWASLNPADRALISGNGEIGGGLASIGWGPGRELGEVLAVILKGTAWYYLFAIPVSLVYILATVGLFCGDGDKKQTAAARCLWATKIFLLCIAAVAPLFVLAADWGRWIIAVNMMTAPLICAGEFTAPLPFPARAPHAGFAQITSSSYVGFACGVLLLLTALTFRIPECCLVGSGDGFTKMEFQLFTAATRALRPK